MRRCLPALLARPAPPMAVRVAVAVAIVAVETVVLVALPVGILEQTSGMVYLTGVLAMSVLWGARLGAVTALASVAALGFLPGIALWPAATFLAAASLVSGLAHVAARSVPHARAEHRDSRREATSLATAQAGLRRVATLVARGIDPANVFDAVTEELGRILGRGFPVILIRYDPDGTAARVIGRSEPTDIDYVPVEGDSLVAEVYRTGRAARKTSYTHAAGPNAAIARRVGARSGVGVPVLVGDRVWGVAIVVSTGPEQPPPDAERRMADFTELVATAIANAESRAQLIASRARMVAATDDARRRLERDLHDGVQQRLVSLGLDLRVAQDGLPPTAGVVRQQLGRAVDGLTAVAHDLQELSRGIHPAIVSQGGLAPAIRTLARRSGLPVDLRLHVDRRLPEKIEVAAYYIVSEALTNAAKHAHANTVRTCIETDECQLTLTVQDDGVGGAYREGGSGLLGLQDRVETLGGTFKVLSPLGRGTTLHAELPVRPHSCAAKP
ncbi:GAF domain-containing sensor histidine kinase [Dactylosporangium sp. CS-033363]|uniref:GAF domain-containing sensor histidine kinase n=1 Tax=Dactylosporangium sp. CS-033363 TaxID=3239935 RepID=UPI003D8FC1A9